MKELQSFYNDYVQAFVTGDMLKVSTSFYRAPVLVNSYQVVENKSIRVTLVTANIIQHTFQDLINNLKSRGYSGRSDMEPIKVTNMTSSSSMIQTKGTRYHTNGSVLEYINASYIVEKFDAEVKVDGAEGVTAVDRVGDHDWRITAVYGETTLPIE